MSVTAKLVADSVNTSGNRLSTFVLRYGRQDHAELMTHRAFSRNSASSRAIPFAVTTRRVLDDPFIPEFWGVRSGGMQPGEDVDPATRAEAERIWRNAMHSMKDYAQQLYDLGMHKLRPNRLLEPWTHIEVVVSSTEWNNWYLLRDDKGAEYHIRKLADQMRSLHRESEPVLRQPTSFCQYAGFDTFDLNFYGDDDTPKVIRRTLEYGLQDCWHLPFITDRSAIDFFDTVKESVAHNAWVSFGSVDGKADWTLEDVDRVWTKLLVSRPIHSSPAEHVAVPCHEPHRHGNFVGWLQLRKFLSDESGGDYAAT